MNRNEMLNLLFTMAKEEKDLRHKRYLLRRASELDAEADRVQAEVQLRNLVWDAQRRIAELARKAA